MATATKTARTLQASATNTAAGTTTGSSFNLTTAFGILLTAKITNGATGPTVACSFRVDVSNDNSAWKTFVKHTAGVTNSAVYEFVVRVPQEVMYVRSVFTGNTAQDVTVECFGHELTSVG